MILKPYFPADVGHSVHVNGLGQSRAKLAFCTKSLCNVHDGINKIPSGYQLTMFLIVFRTAPLSV